MRLRSVALAVAPVAFLLAACGGSAEGDEPSVSAVDQAGCDTAYEYGGDAAAGSTGAVRTLLRNLEDAGPDDDYSQAISGRLQILAADALLITSGADAPNIADHVDAAYEACTGIGWSAPSS